MTKKSDLTMGNVVLTASGCPENRITYLLNEDQKAQVRDMIREETKELNGRLSAIERAFAHLFSALLEKKVIDVADLKRRGLPDGVIFGRKEQDQ